MLSVLRGLNSSLHVLTIHTIYQLRKIKLIGIKYFNFLTSLLLGIYCYFFFFFLLLYYLPKIVDTEQNI